MEVPRGRGLLPVPVNVSEGYGTSVVHVTCSYRATPKYQATGVSSGQEAPKAASLSPTVLRVQH